MTKLRHVALGFFVVAGLALIGFLIVWFGAVARFIRPHYTVQGHLPSAMSVRPGKVVHVDGMEVGEVVDVTSSQPQRPGAWIHMHIRAEHKVPAGAQFVAQQSAVGDIMLDFRTEKPSEEHLPTDGSARVDGVIRAPTLLPEDMMEQVRRGLSAIKRVEPMLDHLLEMTEPRSLEEVEAGEPASLSSAIAQFQATAKSIHVIASDPRVEKLLSGIERLEKAFDGLQALMDKGNALAAEWQGSGKEAREALAEIRALVADVRDGKGTLGKLATDPELHDALTTLVENLDSMVRNADRLMTLWREEGILAKQEK
jgi:phospholipid/cholesterol/gamma-HCH transport system substrate-binding protein